MTKIKVKYKTITSKELIGVWVDTIVKNDREVAIIIRETDGLIQLCYLTDIITVISID